MNKVFIASDIHGSAWFCRKMLEAYEKEQAGRMILLGDLLYHGPRNDLPKEYAPKEVIDLLNAHKHEICAVRGNCEAEVDQMVLEFPVMADYMVLVLPDSPVIYATHGHIWNAQNLPPLMAGDVLLHGHTHLLGAEMADEHWIINPGSVSIPKGGNPPSYAVLADGIFTIKELDGSVIREVDLRRPG